MPHRRKCGECGGLVAGTNYQRIETYDTKGLLTVEINHTESADCQREFDK